MSEKEKAPKSEKTSRRNYLGYAGSGIVGLLIGGGATYLATQPGVVGPGEVSRSAVENYLSSADPEEVAEIVKNSVPQEVLAKSLKTPRKVTIGYIWSFPHDGSGWCSSSEVSMEWMKQRYPFIESYRKEDVGPEDINALVTSLIEKEGCEIIYINDEFIALPVFDISPNYPDVYFSGESVGSADLPPGKNFIRGAGKLYQAAYLCGLMAGSMTKSNAIAGIWSYPVSFLTRIVNGFTLGVLETNPDAQVYGGYVQSWYDPPTEREVSNLLIDTHKCDVMFQMTDSAAPGEVAKERGIWNFAPYDDQVRLGWNTEDVIMSSFIFQRHVYWDRILKDYLSGIKDPQQIYYVGYEDPLYTADGVISPIDIACNGRVGSDGISEAGKAELPKEILDLVKNRREQLIRGLFDPYRDYEIVDINGKVWYKAGEYPSIENLLNEVYFIKGTVPPKE